MELQEFEYNIQTFIDFYRDEYPSNIPAIKGILVYIGSPNILKNNYYLGRAPFQDMASQITMARGCIGTNYKYLIQLEEYSLPHGYMGCDHEFIIGLAIEVWKFLGVF